MTEGEWCTSPAIDPSLKGSMFAVSFAAGGDRRSAASSAGVLLPDWCPCPPITSARWLDLSIVKTASSMTLEPSGVSAAACVFDAGS
eukprot:160167-Rhodomonas_salina.2